MKQEEINEVVGLHWMWLRNVGGGKLANLSGANLLWAVHAWSQVAFMGHGESGRMLTAVIFKNGDAPVYQCGCFSGSADELTVYIASGEECYKASRTRAFEIATELLNFPKP